MKYLTVTWVMLRMAASLPLYLAAMILAGASALTEYIADYVYAMEEDQK